MFYNTGLLIAKLLAAKKWSVISGFLAYTGNAGTTCHKTRVEEPATQDRRPEIADVYTAAQDDRHDEHKAEVMAAIAMCNHLCMC